MRVLKGIRKTAMVAFTALLGCCLPVSAANGRQNSDSGTKTSKSDATSASAAKSDSSAAKKTSPRRHSTNSSSAASSKSSRKATTASSKKRSSRKKSGKLRGQQKIDSERAQAIQEALIREHYLTGDATGTWSQASEEAMRRYQADHGWQSKTVPDSRALISLGLGPSKDHLLNPESAMTTVPDPPKSQSLPATSHGTPSVPEPVMPPSSTRVETPAASDPSAPQ